MISSQCSVLTEIFPSVISLCRKSRRCLSRRGRSSRSASSPRMTAARKSRSNQTEPFLCLVQLRRQTHDLCAPPVLAASPSTSATTPTTSPCTSTPASTPRATPTPSCATLSLGVPGVRRKERATSLSHAGRNARCVGAAMGKYLPPSENLLV